LHQIAFGSQATLALTGSLPHCTRTLAPLNLVSVPESGLSTSIWSQHL